MEKISKVQNCSFGKCLVADVSINTATIVQKIEGEVFKWENISSSEICHAILINDDNWIIINTDARYINHSCDPNCSINENLEVVSLRPIQAGEQLTISYNIVHKGENPGTWDPRWSFKCLCGANNCLGFIDKYINEDGNIWTPPLGELQKIYIPKEINEKID